MRANYFTTPNAPDRFYRHCLLSCQSRKGLNASFCFRCVNETAANYCHFVVEVYGFKSFAKLLRLGYVFFKTESFESFKKYPASRGFSLVFLSVVLPFYSRLKYPARRVSFPTYLGRSKETLRAGYG